ncbi:multidrug resistance-associated protein 1-like protein, partial [Leptotrombidium deliense]
MKSPMSFFETTPIGRIVNRFGKDVDVIDVTLLPSLSNWIIYLFEFTATIILIETQTPLFVVVFIPIVIVFYIWQKIYVSSSRQLKRLESVTRSPIYSHFGATLSGVSTIRAYNAENRFIEESYSRVDANQKCYYPSVASNRWIGLRLEICSSLITLFAGIFAVLARNSLTGGAIGLSITYALNTTLILNWLVRNTSDIETQVTSIERIVEYTNLPLEADWEKSEVSISPEWPQNGHIQFENY